MKKIGFDLNMITESVIAFVSIVLCILFSNYAEAILGFKWMPQFYGLAPIPFIILVLLQLNPIISSIKKLDYIKLSRKLALSALVAVTLTCFYLFPSVYRNYAFASKQPTFKVDVPAKFTYRKGFRNECIDFEFSNKQYSLSISHRDARQLEEGQKFGIDYCMTLSLKHGLDSTVVLQNSQIHSCK